MPLKLGRLYHWLNPSPPVVQSGRLAEGWHLAAQGLQELRLLLAVDPQSGSPGMALALRLVWL